MKEGSPQDFEQFAQQFVEEVNALPDGIVPEEQRDHVQDRIDDAVLFLTKGRPQRIHYPKNGGFLDRFGFVQVNDVFIAGMHTVETSSELNNESNR